ncbi:MAG: helix-turn-helix domain-containing protein [Bacteroidota bacterium]
MSGPQPPNLPPLMTVQAVADYFGVSEPTIWRWLREGKLKGIKIGNARRFSAKEIASFINSGRNEESPPLNNADTAAGGNPAVHATPSASVSWPGQAKETLAVYGADSRSMKELSPHGLVAALRRRLHEMRQEQQDRGGPEAYTSEDALWELRGERS